MEIKETKDLVVAVNELAIVILEQLKDGLQLGEDAMAIISKWQNDNAFKLAIQNAIVGITAIPEEVKDLDINEGVELAGLQLSYLPKIISAAKKGE